MTMNMYNKLASLLLLTALLPGCTPKIAENPAEALIAELKKTYAPDKRVARFELELRSDNGQWVLTGETDQREALKSLRDSLAQLGISYTDSVSVWPEASLGADTLGVVRLSVANLRSNPAQSAELATQATLGTPVKILKKEGSWWLTQTPDGYIAWGDDGTLQPMTAAAQKRWMEAPKLIYTRAYGHSYTQETNREQIVSDLVAGDVLELLGEENNTYKVAYPDGRVAFVAKEEAMPFGQWLGSRQPGAETLTATAKQLMGLPYLWGGTSMKGVDCSGFTKTVYFLNGIILPRDASQQVHTGMLADSVKNFSALQVGDLLFFGRAASDSLPEKVTHVGMWIGNNEFIHSSGDVHISSMDPNAPHYDAFNHDRYLRSKRILGQPDPAVVPVAKRY